MNKHRLQLLEKQTNDTNVQRRVRRDITVRYTSHLHGCIDHLNMAEAHLGEYLDGKNRLGLITNISNAKYEIKKYLLPERVNNECGC
jgi:hypothetical protein